MSTLHRAVAASLGATTVLVAPAAVQAAPAERPAPSTEAAESRCNGALRYPLSNGNYQLNPAYNGWRYCFLEPGDEGLAVTKLQDGLEKCYGQNLGPAGVDGKYGDYTTRAVQNVQRFKDQTPDGVYDGELFGAGFQFAVYDRNNHWTGDCTSE
jgi:hypothetical protein